VAPAGATPLTVREPPRSYAITYRIERYDRHAVVVSTDRIQVRRPFDARVLSTINGKQTGLRVSRFGALVLAPTAGATSIVSPPSPATADLRPDIVLGEIEPKVLPRREQRVVLGRRCQVYRTGSAISAGILIAAGARVGEHSDFCIDTRGLVLEEVWFKDGRPLQRRVATALEVDPDLGDALFGLEGERALGRDQGDGLLQPIDPASGYQGTIYRLPAPPAGFGYEGRFLVQPPRLSLTANSPDVELPQEQISIMDVWTRGADLLILTQTIAASFSALPPKPGVSSRIDLGPLGTADFIFDLRSNEVRIELPQARFVRLTGTLHRDELVALAKSLQAEQGTGPRVIDPQPLP
jgi:hypothetical protein